MRTNFTNHNREFPVFQTPESVTNEPSRWYVVVVIVFGVIVHFTKNNVGCVDDVNFLQASEMQEMQEMQEDVKVTTKNVKKQVKNKDKDKVKARRVRSVAVARPQVTVYDVYGRATKKSLRTPDVLLTPIRTDVVVAVHTQMNKNYRQPYAVKCGWGPKGIVAGMQVAASSWGTGRAVSRIPRVRGGGTHRAGQGAYGTQLFYIFYVLSMYCVFENNTTESGSSLHLFFAFSLSLSLLFV